MPLVCFFVALSIGPQAPTTTDAVPLCPASHDAASELADLAAAQGDTDAGVFRLAVALGAILLLCLGQQQGQHGVGIHHPHLYDLGTLIACIVVAGVASDLMLDEVCLLILPRGLDADAVVGGADVLAYGALILHRGAVLLIGISAAVGIRHAMPKDARQVDLPAASIGHRVACVHLLCCLIESSEGIEVALLCCGEGDAVGDAVHCGSCRW